MKAIHNRGSSGRQRRIVLATALAVAAMGPVAAHAADNLPNLGGDVDPWKVDVVYENDTHYRGKDNTGKNVGLSKFRNTIQAEADKKAGDGWGLHGVFRTGDINGPPNFRIGQQRHGAGRTGRTR